MKHPLLRFLILFFVFLTSCKLHSDIMFQTEDSQFQKLVKQSKENYPIRKNDLLELTVYTNNGEKIIDPNEEFVKETSGMTELKKPVFLVQPNGKVKLPMVGEIAIEGLTVYQADSLLSVAYSKFYEGAFVVSRPVNKRVIVIGALGGKVIPLENENMNLIEVIALYGGVTPDGKANDIRLIRGDLTDPQVEVIDLSTIDGMKRAMLNVEPNDIVYIQRKPKILSESFRQITPVLSIIMNMFTVTYLIIRISKL